MLSGVTVTVEQAATLSPQAVSFLRKLRHLPLAQWIGPYITSPNRILKLRAQFDVTQAAIEEALIAKYNLTVKNIRINNVSVVVIEPAAGTIKPENENRILLNIHGGAFVLGNARDRTGLLMAAEMGVRVYSIEYDLAPEARYPVARDQCLRVYRALLEKTKVEEEDDDDDDDDDAHIHTHTKKRSQRIMAMSSSSGCQLMCSMLLCAQKEGLPMPASQYLCTPTVDLTGVGDSLVFNESRDIIPVPVLVGMVKQNYMPEEVDPRDPLYSPLYAEYNSDFPPTVISTGTRDHLLSSSTRMYWKLREAGVPVELLVGEGMWHGFNWEESMPEAVRMRAAVQMFLSSQTHNPPHTPDLPATR